MLVELKNGETLNGHLVNCDTWMNLTLKEVVQTSPVRRRYGATHHLDPDCLDGRADRGAPRSRKATDSQGYQRHTSRETMYVRPAACAPQWHDKKLTRVISGADQIPTGARRDHRHCEGATSEPPGWLPGRKRRAEPRRPRRKRRRSGRPWERPGSRARKGERIEAAPWCETFTNDRHTMIPTHARRQSWQI